MIEKQMMLTINTSIHPLDFDDLNPFLYVTPETPVLIEKPLVLIVPPLVRKLGEIPDLLTLSPKPFPRFILF